MNNFPSPMEAWPTLGRYNKIIRLSKWGYELFYYQAGDKDLAPMVLLHGLGDEADTWRHLIEPLSAQFHVIAPDLPGFGRSDKPRSDYTLSFFVKTILELLDQLKLPKAYILGSSLGAIISQKIALDHPERVSALGLLDGTILTRKQPLRLQTLLFLVPGIGEFLYNRLRKDPQAAYKTLFPYYFDLDALPETDRQFLYQRVNQRVWADDQRRAYFSVLRNLAREIIRLQTNLGAKLSESLIPTLIVWGAEDQIIPVENAHALAQIQPTARLALIPGCGHLPQQETPDELLNIILEKF